LLFLAAVTVLPLIAVSVAFRVLLSVRTAMTRLLRIAAAGVLLMVAPPLAAQDTRALSDRLQRLETEIRTLQQQVFQGRPATGAGAPATFGEGGAVLQTRLQQVEEDIRRLTGQIEELAFQLSRVTTRLDRLSSDLEFRLDELEKRGGAPAPAARPGQAATPPATQPGPGSQPGPLRPPGQAAASPPLATTPPAARPGQATAAAPAPTGTPQDQYETAFDLLTRAQYPAAEAAFRQFVASHPQHQLAGNAQYWLGETFYVRNNFEEAARQFLQGYQRYPQNSKAPDNLLKLGLSLGALNRRDDACAALGRFQQDYPTALAALRRRANEERQRLNCR
jgi:tol-pal system protein YbgF